MGKQGKSYVPSGLTAKQYDEIRKGQVRKKQENYAKNVAKAGIFEDYTDWTPSMEPTSAKTGPRTRTPLDTEWPRPSMAGPVLQDSPSRTVVPEKRLRTRRRRERDFLSERNRLNSSTSIQFSSFKT